MASKWTVLHLESTFVVILEERSRELSRAIESACNLRRDPQAELDAWQAFFEFSEAIQKVLKASDPTRLLKSVRDEANNTLPNYYCLTVGEWIAYYRIDIIEKVCTGVLIRRTLDDPIETLSKALEATHQSNS